MILLVTYHAGKIGALLFLPCGVAKVVCIVSKRRGLLQLLSRLRYSLSLFSLEVNSKQAIGRDKQDLSTARW